MRRTTKTIDFFAFVWIAFVVLLMVGTIPFTAASVGAAIILSHINLTVSWS